MGGGRLSQLPILAAELVGFQPDVIVASGAGAVRAAKRATRQIPIIIAGAADPVGEGLVASLAPPLSQMPTFRTVQHHQNSRLCCVAPNRIRNKVVAIRAARKRRMPAITAPGLASPGSDPQEASTFRLRGSSPKRIPLITLAAPLCQHSTKGAAVRRKLVSRVSGVW